MEFLLRKIVAVLGTTKNGAVMTRAAVDRVAEDPLGAVLPPALRQAPAVTVWHCSKIFILQDIKHKEAGLLTLTLAVRLCKDNRL